MQLSGHTILLTGGSSGIGLALAQRFVAAGNVVIVTGRRDSALDEVRRTLPSVITVASDSGNAADRTRLAAEMTTRFPALDVVINNAGIQRAVDNHQVLTSKECAAGSWQGRPSTIVGDVAIELRECLIGSILSASGPARGARSPRPTPSGRGTHRAVPST